MSGLSLKTHQQGEEKDNPDLQKNSRQVELSEEQAQTVFVILDSSESFSLLRWVLAVCCAESYSHGILHGMESFTGMTQHLNCLLNITHEINDQTCDWFLNTSYSFVELTFCCIVNTHTHTNAWTMSCSECTVDYFYGYINWQNPNIWYISVDMSILIDWLIAAFRFFFLNFPPVATC